MIITTCSCTKTIKTAQKALYRYSHLLITKKSYEYNVIATKNLIFKSNELIVYPADILLGQIPADNSIQQTIWGSSRQFKVAMTVC